MSLKERLGAQFTTGANHKQQEKETFRFGTEDAPQEFNTLGEIENLFCDDEINSISVLGAKNVFVEKKGRKTKFGITFRDNVRLENVIRKNAKFHGIKIDDEHPYIEFNHKQGINVKATLPPLSNVATMIIKCYRDKFANLKSLTEAQAMSKEIALFIEALALLKLNIIIAGKRNTLKTTLLSAIAKKVPQNNTGIVFDYAKELKFENSNITTYDFKNYENNELIDSVFYSNPDKIFINDCPDLTFFEKYIESGYRGICATYCTDNPFDVLQEIYLKKADVVIFVEKKDPKRLISSISLVNGSELENIFYLNEFLEHNSTGIVPEFYENIEQGGISMSSAIFEADYKHTYFALTGNDSVSMALKKSLNPEILKKFKKGLEIKEDSQDTPAEVQNTEETPEDE